MAITKNDEEVKINSGNNFKVFYNSAWITLGNIVSGRLNKKGESKEIKYASGYKFNKRGSSAANLMVVLAQVSKEILDTIDNILASGTPLYFYNGRDNGVDMEIYCPSGNLIENIDLTMAGDEHQTISLEFSLAPQSGNAAVTPDDDLPDDAYKSGSGELTGTNPFYIILETDVV